MAARIFYELHRSTMNRGLPQRDPPHHPHRDQDHKRDNDSHNDPLHPATPLPVALSERFS